MPRPAPATQTMKYTSALSTKFLHSVHQKTELNEKMSLIITFLKRESERKRERAREKKKKHFKSIRIICFDFLLHSISIETCKLGISIKSEHKYIVTRSYIYFFWIRNEVGFLAVLPFFGTKWIHFNKSHRTHINTRTVTYTSKSERAVLDC